MKKKMRTRYVSEKPSNTPRRSPIKAQNELYDSWDAYVAKQIDDLKKAITKVLKK
jgi:hypothetical protein